VGSTVVEFWDFFTSRFFDTKDMYERRKEKQGSVFPRPQADLGYLWSWVGVLLLSLLVSFREGILAWLCGP
jgi:hypothetical protein